MTNTFNTPLLAHDPWQLAYSIKDYGRVSAEFCQLMVEGNRIAQIFYLYSEDNICSGLKPTLITPNGTVDYIEVNMSNEEFHPTKVPSKILKHEVILSPTTDVPNFAAAKGADKVPGTLIGGIAWKNAILTVDCRI